MCKALAVRGAVYMYCCNKHRCEKHLNQTLQSTGSVLVSAFLTRRYVYLLQFPLLVLSELEVQRLAVLCDFQVYVLVRGATHFKQAAVKK